MGLSLCPIISDYSRSGSSVMGHSVTDQTLRQLKMHILRVTLRSNDLQIQTQQRSTHCPQPKETTISCSKNHSKYLDILSLGISSIKKQIDLNLVCTNYEDIYNRFFSNGLKCIGFPQIALC